MRGLRRNTMTERFVHLHTHTEYSLLDGAARIEAPKSNPTAPTVFTEALAHDMPALAMTDHGAMFGTLKFYEAARAVGIKPIIGVEAYVAPGSRFDRTPGESEEKYYHLTLLAEDETGYRNLLKLVSQAYLEGFYHRPRMDKQLLAEHAEGLLCLSGLPVLRDRGAARRGAAGSRARDGRRPTATSSAPTGTSSSCRITASPISGRSCATRSSSRARSACRWSRRTTSTTRGPTTRSRTTCLLCIQQQKLQSDPKRLKFDAEDFYLKSAAEMRRVFAELPEACDMPPSRSPSVCSCCPSWSGCLVEGTTEYRLPRFETPAGEPLESYLRELVERGAVDRYGDPLSTEVIERTDHELSIISKMGFAGYFLIVWDLIRFAREQGIRVGPGRGSAAGSVVSYALRITDLDPLRYGLLFERFLNPDRIEMPDIDMDFDERRRDEVIRYATEKYGSDHVAQIVTFQTIKGKQGIRDAARVLGFPPRVGDELCKMYPPAIMGRDEPIDSALQTSPELREAYERQPEAREIIDTARALEGLRREDSVHAAGVVIGDRPLVEYLPLKLTKDSRDDAKKMVTQFDMNGVAQLGLLKMDFLGLRNLSVIEETLRHLRTRDIDLDIDHVPLDDEPTYAMLRRGDTIGVFQMESPGMKNLIKLLEPDRFEDLMACNALYRPGLLSMGQHTEYAERKHGRKKVTYLHPDLEPVLKDTYGIIVYQEQVMQTAVAIAGLLVGRGRHACARSWARRSARRSPPSARSSCAGAVARGHDRRSAEGMFEYIEPFADYGFNASHACAYGYVAYQTAYLMAHHPVEYMAAILTSVKDEKDRKPYYLYACRGMGIEVLPPDVNESDMDFAPGARRPPGDPIRAVGRPQRRRRRRARASSRRARTAGRSRRSPTSAGVSSPPRSRSACSSRSSSPARSTRSGTPAAAWSSRWGSSPPSRRCRPRSSPSARPRPPASSPCSADRVTARRSPRSTSRCSKGPSSTSGCCLSKEKEMLGQFVTDHPLLGVEAQLAAQTTAQIPELEDRDDGELVVLGGIIGALARKFTKRGEPYAQFRLEGLTGGVEVVAFPSVYEGVPDLFEPDRIILVTGRIDRRGRELQIRASDVKEPLLDTSVFTDPGVLVVDLPAAVCSPGVLEKLKTLLEGSPGDVPVRLRFLSSGGVQPLSLGAFTVNGQGSLLDELRHLLGPTAARLEHEPV